MKKVFGIIFTLLMTAQSLFSQGLEIGGGADLVMYNGTTSFAPRVSVFYPELFWKKKMGVYATVNIFPGNRLIDNIGLTYKINNKISAYYGRAIFDMMTPRPELFPFTGRQDLGISYYPENSIFSVKAGWAFWLGPTAQVTFRLKEIFPGDSDKDGVNDKKDKCPNTPEKYAQNVNVFGCPTDTDNDGVFDLDDACPNEAGIVSLNGCPDSDKDGIPNSKDKCPDVSGLKEFEGCPDSDGDGIIDSEDDCPDIAGITENAGCPVVEDTVVVVDTIAENTQDVYKMVSNIAQKSIIFFEFNAKTTNSKELEKLKLLVDFLNKNPKATVTLIGHGDDRGSDEINMEISDARASYYVNELTKLGVSSSRLKYYGVGKAKPIFTEDEKNRCVEVRIKLD